jgi:hypothetical protein
MSTVPLAGRKIIHSVGNDVGMKQRPVAGEILMLDGKLDATGAAFWQIEGSSSALGFCLILVAKRVTVNIGRHAQVVIRQ